MNTPEEVEAILMQHLEQALGMTLDLSEDDSVYDIQYIAGNLAKCSTYQEKLASSSIALTKIKLALTQKASAQMVTVRRMGEKLKASPEYEDQPRAARADWLSNQLEGHREVAESWKLLNTAVSEVMSAVAERSTTMKRLDSALRLQSKLLEAKVAAGATSPHSFAGDGKASIDLD